jgi:N-methylhydantoinase A
VQAIGVALLWSIANPIHEQTIGEIIEEEWPSILYSLSHQVNPCIREYRRTSSTVIDASLKPIVSRYVLDLRERLKKIGHRGELFMLTSSGGVISAEELVARPIYSVDSGPALAPSAGKLFAVKELGRDNVVTVDMGGTSFDVSCITKGEINVSREALVGSHMLGINKVDSKSIGAGGGSVAWVDRGGLLHVGPQSAGAVPGPACYGKGGEGATVTDADLVLGYLDPNYFLGGKMTLKPRLAREVIEQKVGKLLSLKLEEAAFAIWGAVNANMITAIQDITIWQGIDPREYVFVSGGGAAGLHIIAIAKELGAKNILIPKTAGALSAFGGVFADIATDFSATRFTVSNNFDYKGVNTTLESLERQASAFLQRTGVTSEHQSLNFYVEARYPYQVWDLSVPLRSKRMSNEKKLAQLVEDFHQFHERVFAIKEPGQYIECIYWRVRATGELAKQDLKQIPSGGKDASRVLKSKREAYFKELGGMIQTPVYRGNDLLANNVITGPAIIEELTTTIVVPPGAKATVTKWASYIIELD